MAPSFRHGKGTCIWFNGADMSNILNDSNYNANADAVDVTAYRDDDRKFIAGLKNADGDFSGMADGSTDEADMLFERALATTGADIITIGLGGGSTGDFAFLGSGRITGYNVSSPVDGVVAANASVQYTSEARDGIVVANSTNTATATTHASNSLSSFTGSSATTAGAVGHFHVFRGTTSASATVELAGAFQDSSDNATWADVIAIADVDSTAPENASQRVLSTGTLYDFVRFRVSAQGSTDIDYAAAIGRRI